MEEIHNKRIYICMYMRLLFELDVLSFPSVTMTVEYRRSIGASVIVLMIVDVIVPEV